MVRWIFDNKVGALRRGAALLIVVFATFSATAQDREFPSDFQIVWISVGEVAADVDGGPARAGRQLFMAPDLVAFSLKKVSVARVDVEPSIIELSIGERFCLTSLRVQANGDDRNGVENAPLSVSVRQDQRERMGLERGTNNICLTPTAVGEFPVRLNSLLPARDGTTRGAQFFVRVHESNAQNSTAQTVRASASNRD